MTKTILTNSQRSKIIREIFLDLCESHSPDIALGIISRRGYLDILDRDTRLNSSNAHVISNVHTEFNIKHPSRWGE